MADVPVQSANPTVTFKDGSGNDWFRIRGNSSTELAVGYYNGFSWDQRFKFTSTDNVSTANLQINSSAPTLTFDSGSDDFSIKNNGAELEIKESSAVLATFDSAEISAKVNVEIEKASPTLQFVDTTGGAADYSIGASSSLLEVRENTSTLLATFSSTELNSKKDMRIEKSTPTLTLDAGGTDYGISTNGTLFFLKANSTTVAQSDGTNFYANNALGAGTTSAAHAFMVRIVTGTLSGSGSDTISIPGFANNVIGGSVMLGVSTQEGSGTFHLVDFLSTASAGGADFFADVIRASGGAGGDKVTINYGGSYTSSSTYYIVAYGQ